MSKRNGLTNSVNGLLHLPKPNAEAVPVIPTVGLLVDALRSSSALVRRWAAIQLGRLGALAVAAVPALQTAQCDKNGSVRREAQRALSRIKEQGARDKSSVWMRFLKSLREAFATPAGFPCPPPGDTALIHALRLKSL